jgi:hypothetical protein
LDLSVSTSWWSLLCWGHWRGAHEKGGAIGRSGAVLWRFFGGLRSGLLPESGSGLRAVQGGREIHSLSSLGAGGASGTLARISARSSGFPRAARCSKVSRTFQAVTWEERATLS